MKSLILLSILLISVFIAGCAKAPSKQYYELNYIPGIISNRYSETPYPFVIRLKEFDIEEAYNRPQIVYRQSPFELRYYVYRVWAVKPSRMFTDLVYKHLLNVNLVSLVTRRFDEGSKPQYELTGMIEALEEYDSDELWFAHVSLRINLTHITDARIVYNRRFDLRKKVLNHDPELVIRELSALVEYAITQSVQDIDYRLAVESGIIKSDSVQAQKSSIPDSLNAGGLN